MRGLTAKALLALFFITSLAYLGGCSSGEDSPFVFSGPNPSNNPPPPPPGGSSGTAGSGGVSGSAGSAGGGVAGSAGGAAGGTGGTVQTPQGACPVNFNATLTLKIDDANTRNALDQFDSPPACTQYPPATYKDLYCCTAADVTAQDQASEESATVSNPVAGGPELFCTSSANNRHGGQPELAVTRWPAASPISLSFDLSNLANGVCKVYLNTVNFPEYRIENSALDASLIINAGGDYLSPSNPGFTQGKVLNPPQVEGTCKVTNSGSGGSAGGGGGSGSFKIDITALPLRFFVKLYNNVTQCSIRDGLTNCGPSFSTRLTENDPVNSYQIIPGFDATPSLINFNTDTQQSVQPIVPVSQRSALTVQGRGLQFANGQSTMRLVTAFTMPDGSTSRNDSTGEGQLLTQIKQALMTAELRGTVTKNGNPITSLSDLQNCGAGGGGGGSLSLSMTSTFNGVADNLTLAQGATGYSTTACVPGKISSGSCTFDPPPSLPFAMDVSDQGASGALIRKFQNVGVINIQNSQTGASVPLQVPASVGAFQILNASALQNITLARGNS
ncbi:MAG: hypothetical protein HY073_01135, partial [Deltaproteobacteria bacterium]|nr:hypothetical protein [Deltaproteobacteria bacterium]